MSLSNVSSSEHRHLWPAHVPLAIPGVTISDSTVDFFGIPFTRGSGGAFLPNIENFKADTITQFDVEFLQDLVVAWSTQGIPLFEGGSGIGKSRAINRMGAILNQDVYKVQGNEDMTPDEIFGHMGLRAGTRSGLGFVEKSGTLALMHGGILWFDEPNALPPESHIRLRELLDAISNGKRHFELAEDKGRRRIQIHPLTRVVLTQNEANGKNPALALIRPPDFGRYNYIRLPEELPEGARCDRMLGRLGAPADVELKQPKRFTYHEGFSFEQLGSMLESAATKRVFFDEYNNFVTSLRGLVNAGKLARDQRQPIYFDSERDSIKFLRHVAILHSDNLEESAREALRYVFVKRFLSDSDRLEVEELVQKFTFEIGDDDDRIDAENAARVTFTGLERPSQMLIKSLEQMDFEEVLASLPVGGRAVIGRHPECQLRIDSILVSRKHAMIIKQEDHHYLVRDLGSTNGTKINGSAISSATVRAGAELSVGSSTFIFPDEEPVEPVPVPRIEDPFRIRPVELGFETISSLGPADFFNRAYQFRGAHGAPDSWTGSSSSSLERAPAPGITPIGDRVSFLGAELKKSVGELERHLPIEFFANDVLTEYDIRLMKSIAATLALHQIPVLEGGPGIGKGRTADRIASYLGQELYYQLGGKYPARVLFGKLTVSDSSPSGFEYADGKATLAARNGGLLFIDEPNALSPGTWVYLRNLFDAYLARESSFTMLLAGEPRTVPIHPDFRIILGQNEATPGDPLLSTLKYEDFNRLVYIKLFDEMPEHIFRSRFLGRLGEQPEVNIRQFEELTSQFQKTREEIFELLGSVDMARRLWNVYEKFFYSMREDLGKTLAPKRHQQVFLNYERLEERILTHLMYFYDGDFLRSLRASVYHYCCNMFESESEKEIVRNKFKQALESEPQLLGHLRSLRGKEGDRSGEWRFR